MGGIGQSLVLNNTELFPAIESASWFAIQIFARHEKHVATELRLKGIDSYLPIVTRLQQWSDRKKQVDLPLFPCYAFVHIFPSPEQRVRVLQVPGVIGLVGGAGHGIAIPDEQIEHVRTLLKNKIPLDPYPFLKIGQRVRIHGGSLEGIEGILVRRNGTRRLIISVDGLERSLSLSVEGLEVEGI